jgi:hypothetical protein
MGREFPGEGGLGSYFSEASDRAISWEWRVRELFSKEFRLVGSFLGREP